MPTKKKTAKKTQARTQATTATNGALAPGLPVPKVNAPPVPAGWKKTKWPKPKGGLRPKRAQIANLTGSAGELQKSKTYATDFGNKAPDPQVLATSMTTASGWRDSWVAAKEWLAFCSDQRRLWEEDALEKVAALKPAFDYASANDASIAKEYPATMQLMDAPSEIAERGAAVRKAKRQAKSAPVPSASTPPAVTH